MSPKQSAAVYRRRRLALMGILLLVLVAVGAGAWLLVAQPWAQADAGAEAPQKPAATASGDPSTWPEPSTEPSPEESADDLPEESMPPEAPAAPAACQASDIEVEAKTDAESYASGALPKLSISLTNRGEGDCTIDVGSSLQTFTVSSGADVWWRSTDCQQNPSSMIVTLAAGQTATSAEPVVWDRTRSSVDTCDNENRPRAPGAGASYHVSVSIGGFASVATRQIFLH